MPIPRFRWSPRAAQYIDSRGRFVPRSEIRAAIDATLDHEQAMMRTAALSLQSGDITLEMWRDAMRQSIKNLHLFSAAAAKGGWAQLDRADAGRVGQLVRREYGYLERFAREIAGGTYDLDGRFLTRVELYQQAGRDTYHMIEQQVVRKSGKTEYRNKLNPADHCRGVGSCIEQTAKGWRKIGSLIPIGRRICLRRCRCEWEYR